MVIDLYDSYKHGILLPSWEDTYIRFENAPLLEIGCVFCIMYLDEYA